MYFLLEFKYDKKSKRKKNIQLLLKVYKCY